MTDIEIYTDKEVELLKIEINKLEIELKEKIEIKSNYENMLNEFNEKYNLVLGELIKEILELKQQSLKKEIEISDENEDLKNEYEYFKKEYKKFSDEYEELIENNIELTEEEKKELKKLYRDCVKICHPDIVDDKFKEKSTELIQKLNEYYSKKDINEVRKIYNYLINEKPFEIKEKNDLEELEKLILELKSKLENLKLEIENIETDEDFILVNGLSNWDEYFEEVRNELEEEKNNLTNQL